MAIRHSMLHSVIVTLYVVMKVAKSKYCIIYKDLQIIIILGVLLVKSGALTRIIHADPKLEYLYAHFCCVIGVISD